MAHTGALPYARARLGLAAPAFATYPVRLSPTSALPLPLCPCCATYPVHLRSPLLCLCRYAHAVLPVLCADPCRQDLYGLPCGSCSSSGPTDGFPCQLALGCGARWQEHCCKACTASICVHLRSQHKQDPSCKHFMLSCWHDCGRQPRSASTWVLVCSCVLNIHWQWRLAADRTVALQVRQLGNLST